MAVRLTTCESPLWLDDLSAQICSSSNFRFVWRFYQCIGVDPQSPASIRLALESIIANPRLHAFMREGFTPIRSEELEIEPLHEHCRVDATSEFEITLAMARGGYLGAYTKKHGVASGDEKQAITEKFECMGEYEAYELFPGSVPGCPECADHNNHLFSGWFYNVAWDWCFLVLWPRRSLLWMGCLTDTD